MYKNALTATARTILVFFLLLFSCHILKSVLIVRQMNRCGTAFEYESIVYSTSFQNIVRSLSEPFGVVMLNQYAIDVTLNWLCNTKDLPEVHNNTLFFTLDDIAAQELRRHYPALKIFTWEASCLQGSFKPLDATYMSFFLLRTNLIRALIFMRKDFWMLQADTFWRKNLFDNNEYKAKDLDLDVALDQQGHEKISTTRKRQMNGANFLVMGSKNSTRQLFDEIYWYQSRFYVTDPDVMRIICNKKKYQCNFIDHSIISGWEWIYDTQTNPPQLLQMDGELSGGKIEALKYCKFWFLDEKNQCVQSTVTHAQNLAASGRIPRHFSNSKVKQKILLSIGEFLSKLPLFGGVYHIYGGLPSLYLQFF